ncbi:uncharacterized protein LOC123542712 [Mercenaria mercenaria]|uniref:uncharacterized protein LOC123542712 n=1 Tax=Mercenaria mercenaria TaxID=6596 RepID=UPI00234F909A|nr:uncharacterized protein LOC123542712 [Mercenaria mercenaria]
MCCKSLYKRTRCERLRGVINHEFTFYANKMAVSGRRGLNNLLSTTLRFGSEEDTVLYCHPCELNGQTVDANGYCQNCRENLCNSCINSHQKATTTRNHTVSKNFEFLSTAVASDKLQSCSAHQNEEVKLYCRAHETLGCVICMTISHKLCEIDYIPEVSEQFVKGDEYMSFESIVNKLKERCAIGLSKIEAYIVDIETAYANVISSVETTRKEIMEELDKFERELKEEVAAYRKKNIETMETLTKAYESVVKNIVDTEATTKKMRKDEKYNLLFCEVKQAFARVSKYQSDTYELSTRLCTQDCKFQKSTELNSFLTKESMFGTIHVKDIEQGPCNVPETISRQPVCHINIKGKNDKKTCYATGLALMSYDQLAIADKANKNVKIVDITYDKMISEITLSSSPRDITVIPPDKLAVTLRDENIIQLLSTSSGLSKTEEIKTDGHCRGIKFHNGTLIVAFDNFADYKIQLMTIKGEVLRSIYRSDEGKSFMAEPKCIGLSPDGKQMYLTDLTKMSLYRLSNSNKVTAEFGKRHFMGIAVSGGGSVYACSKANEAVYQLEDDLSNARVILNQTDGVRGPIALAICRERGMLVVSCGSGGAEVCDKLHVFKIKQT